MPEQLTGQGIRKLDRDDKKVVKRPVFFYWCSTAELLFVWSLDHLALLIIFLEKKKGCEMQALCKHLPSSESVELQDYFSMDLVAFS